MTAERWEQVKQLYDSALKRATDERAAYLEQVCAGDAELRREVESLLAYETRADIALMLRAMSSARPMTRLALTPGAGSSSYMVTTGPVRTA